MTKFKVVRYWDTYPDGVVATCETLVRNIYSVSPSSVCIIDRGYNCTDLAYAYKELTFADGSPFGVKVE